MLRAATRSVSVFLRAKHASRNSTTSQMSQSQVVHQLLESSPTRFRYDNPPELYKSNSRIETDPQKIKELQELSFDFLSQDYQVDAENASPKYSQDNDPFSDDDEIMEALKIHLKNEPEQTSTQTKQESASNNDKNEAHALKTSTKPEAKPEAKHSDVKLSDVKLSDVKLSDVKPSDSSIISVASSPKESPKANHNPTTPHKESFSPLTVPNVANQSNDFTSQLSDTQGSLYIPTPKKPSSILPSKRPLAEPASTTTKDVGFSSTAWDGRLIKSFTPPLVNQSRTMATSAPKRATTAPAYPTIQLSTQMPTEAAEPTGKVVKPMILLDEQEYILQQALNGTSLFYTGSAGTGKSVLLKAIIKALKKKYRRGNVAVTASTGLAACNIGGITLHGFSGVGLGNEPVDKLLTKVRRSKKALERWLNTKVLVIDEISMVDGHFLNKLNEIAKRIRRNQRPFGGIQLIVCGDFYQLPPVVKTTDPNAPPKDPFFSFESQAWKENIQLTLILVEVFRQKGDQTFVDMLNEMRTGTVSTATRNEFAKLQRPVNCPPGLSPSQLFATRYEVERSNNERLSKLPGEAQLYTAMDSGSLQEPQRQTILNNFLAPQKLFLKKGAQVMCIKNFDDTLVNGTMGKVVDFMYKDVYMKRKEQEMDHEDADESMEEPKPSISQDYIFSDVMLLLSTKDVSEVRAKNRQRKKDLAAEMENDLKQREYPIVKFTLADGVTTRTVMFEPEVWNIEDERDNTVLASRVQFPLILAWALSIHKSQGQTLRHVKVDLRNVFEKGQAYVALSRATCREGLQVLNFRKDRVNTHPKVKAFYETLLTKETAQKGQQQLPFQYMGNI